MRRRLEPIGDEVVAELQKLGPGGAMADVVRAWPDAVGEPIARSAWPSSLTPNGTLHVATESATWAFELSQLAPTLLARLRDTLGTLAPTALRFAVGALPERERQEAPPAATLAEPSVEERRQADDLTASIGDPELRAAASRAVAAALARARLP